MEQTYAMSEREIEEIVAEEPLFFCPDPKGLKNGDRLYIHHKIGGDYAFVNIMLKSDPYPKGPKSKTILVDIFGYGISESVNVKKLRKKK